MARHKLPTRLHKLLDVAITDFKKVLKTKEYKIDMNSWHSPDFDDGAAKTCHVCLGGSVMAMSLKVPLDEQIAPEDFDVHTQHALHALDALRRSDFRDAVEEVYSVPDPSGLFFESPPTRITKKFREIRGKLSEIRVPSARRNPRGFVKALRKAQKLFESVGL